MPVKRLVTYNDETIPESTDGSVIIRYIEISDVDEVEGIKGTTAIEFGVAPSRARRLIREGDVLVSTVRTYLRAVARVSRKYDGSVASTGFAVLRAKDLVPGYLGYLSRAGFFIEEVIARSVGVSYPAINASDLVRVVVPVPDLAEQAAIADYLDAQTAKIDALIGKQEQLIETLAERRQAVISHAVTKGLDPNVPMKDSGVEWLGQVPIAWSVEAIKRRGLIGAGTGFPPEFQGLEEEEFPFHKVNVLSKADHDGMIRVRSDSVSRETASLLRARIYPAGSLVMAKIGAALLLGRIRVLGTAACIDNNMMCVQPKDKVSSRFLFWALEMVQFDWLVNPGAVPSTSEGAMGNYKLAFPPAEEQSAVANYLDRETAQIDALVAKAREMIDVLKERRQALISAAVTGKIDVRTASGA